MTGPAHDGVVIEITDGVVTAIEPAGTIPHHDATVVRGTATTTVMPGLADMHVHVGDGGQDAMFLANGVTLVRNMWGSTFHHDLAAEVDAGVRPGPRLVTSSPILDGPLAGGAARYPGLTPVTDPDEAAPFVAAAAARGDTLVKVYSDLDPSVLRAVGRAAREHDIPVGGHCPRSLAFEEAIDAGMSSFEHLVEIERGHLCPSAPVTVRSLRERFERSAHLDMASLRRLAGRMAEAGIVNCPTVSTYGRLVAGDQPRPDTALRYVPSAARRRWASAEVTDAAAHDGLVAAARHHRDQLAAVVRLLDEEGASLLVGTDAGSIHCVAGFAIHDELATLDAAGIPRDRLLRMATVDAADSLGRQDLGRVEVGAAADLLVLDRDPTDDLTTLRDPGLVLVNGYALDREALAASLERRAATVDRDADQPDDRLGPMHRRAWWYRGEDDDDA